MFVVHCPESEQFDACVELPAFGGIYRLARSAGRDGVPGVAACPTRQGCRRRAIPQESGRLNGAWNGVQPPGCTERQLRSSAAERRPSPLLGSDDQSGRATYGRSAPLVSGWSWGYLVGFGEGFVDVARAGGGVFEGVYVREGTGEGGIGFGDRLACRA